MFYELYDEVKQPVLFTLPLTKFEINDIQRYGKSHALYVVLAFRLLELSICDWGSANPFRVSCTNSWRSRAAQFRRKDGDDDDVLIASNQLEFQHSPIMQSLLSFALRSTTSSSFELQLKGSPLITISLEHFFFFSAVLHQTNRGGFLDMFQIGSRLR